MDDMGTLTLNMADDVETLFRLKVKEKFGTGKGKLKQGAEEAFTFWIKRSDQEDAKRWILEKLKKGVDGGFGPYRKRDELYDRSL